MTKLSGETFSVMRTPQPELHIIINYYQGNVQLLSSKAHVRRDTQLVYRLTWA